MSAVSVVYWCTRDSDENGSLSPYVDVWMEKPVRHRLTFEGGAVWLNEDGSIRSRHCRATIANILKWGHTIPETDRECLRVETVGSVQ